MDSCTAHQHPLQVGKEDVYGGSGITMGRGSRKQNELPHFPAGNGHKKGLDIKELPHKTVLAHLWVQFSVV